MNEEQKWAYGDTLYRTEIERAYRTEVERKTERRRIRPVTVPHQWCGECHHNTCYADDYLCSACRRALD